VFFAGGPNTPPNKFNVAVGRQLKKIEKLQYLREIWQGDALQSSRPRQSIKFCGFQIEDGGWPKKIS